MVGSGNFCAVALCNNSSRKSKREKTQLSFFRFPRDPALLKQWILKCQRADPINPNNARVCSSHFSEEDFEVDFRSKLMGIPSKRALKKNVVPSLNLPSQLLKKIPAGLRLAGKVLTKKQKELCERHFAPKDIKRTSIFHCASGQVISVPMKVPRLIPGAVPVKLSKFSKFQNSKASLRDESPEKCMIDDSQHKVDGEETLYFPKIEDNSILTFDELKEKLRVFNLSDFWKLIVKEKMVCFINISVCPLPPKVNCSLVVWDTLDVEVFYRHAAIDNIYGNKFPEKITNIYCIDEALGMIESFCCS